MNNGYGICLNEWLEDARIKNELRLLIKISSLTAEKGFCYASNEYFSKYLKITTISVSRQISKLIKLNYLRVEYKMRGSQVERRYLRLTKMLTDGYQKCYPTVIKNVKDNNTSNNNTSIIKEKSKPKKKFQKPTHAQIAEYLKEKQQQLDIDYFIDYYESKDWMIGKNRMKNWKSAINNWLRNEKNYATNKQRKLTQAERTEIAVNELLNG